jgi:hypothetical protein
LIRELQGAKSALPTDFFALRDLRSGLEEQLSNLDRQIPDIRQRLAVAGTAEREFELANNMFQQALERGEKTRKSHWAREVRELSKKERDTAKLAQTVADLESRRRLLSSTLAEVEDAMNRLLSIEIAEQSFKSWVSGIFAALVAIVIGGFFFIAHTDSTVRRRVFSGHSGIQFLTLFALVISIILFGITGVLEGKELSALLGGLAGYILGRATFGSESADIPAPSKGATD